MPQIPMYEGPQAQTRALNLDQANPEAFGAVQGRQLQQLGQGAQQVSNALDAINERETQTQVFNAEAQAKEAYVKWSQEAVKNRQGVAAKGLVKDSQDWWSNAQKDFAKDLSPMAQRMLQKSFSQQTIAAAQSMGQFENNQLEAAQQLSLKATTKSSIDSAVSDSSDANIATQKQNILAAWASQRSKMDPATYDQLVRGELTQMHEAVFNKLFVESPSQAKLYYEVNQKEISGAVKDNILTRLKSGVADEMGGSAAREEFTKAVAGKSYNEAIPVDQIDAALVKRFEGEPEKLKAARSELDRQVALRNKAQSEQQAGAIDGVYGLLNKNTPLATVMRTPQWASLSEQSKRGIQQQIDDRNHMLAARSIEDKNRLEREQQLRMAPAMLIYSQPENLSKMTREGIINLMPEIGVQNASALLQTWQSYQQNQAKLSQATVDSDMFKSVLAGAGIDPNPKPNNKEAAKWVLDLRTQFETRIGQDQQMGKRELTATEKLKIMQEVAHAEVLRPGFFSSALTSPEKVIDLTPEQLLKSGVKVTDPLTGKSQTLTLSSVPTAEYAAVEKQLRKEGLPADPRSVAQAWFDFKQKKGAK